jgi:hypothetical protein
VTEVLLDDLVARGRLSSKEIGKDKLAKVRAGAPPPLPLRPAPQPPVVSGRRSRARRRRVASRPPRPQLLVSEYLRFPLTNASFPLNYCLIYDFMPTAVQQLMSSHCMTI